MSKHVNTFQNCAKNARKCFPARWQTAQVLKTQFTPQQRILLYARFIKRYVNIILCMYNAHYLLTPTRLRETINILFRT